MKFARYKNSSPYSYTLGATITFELVKTHPELVVRVFVRPETTYSTGMTEILEEIRKQNIEIIESLKPFNVLDAKGDCKLIAEFSKPQAKLTADAQHIVLVDPADAGNLGTIMRTAIAYNYSDLAIIGSSVDPYNPKAVRASMGAIFHLNVQHFATFEDYLAAYDGRQLYAFMLDQQAQSLNQAARQAETPYSLIFGNEAAGLPADFVKNTDAQSVFIPQSKHVDSLNLSIAAGIAIYTFSQY